MQRRPWSPAAYRRPWSSATRRAAAPDPPDLQSTGARSGARSAGIWIHSDFCRHFLRRFFGGLLRVAR